MPGMKSLIYGITVVGASATMLAAGDLRRHAGLFLVCLGAASLAYLLVLPEILADRCRKGAIRWLVGSTIAARLLLLPAVPSLSDDIYRYLWDGRILLETGNPYRYPPDDPHLAAYRDARYPLINYREIPTIYPPAAELLFGLSALAGHRWNLLLMKVLLGLSEIGLVLALKGLLRHHRKPAAYLLVYLLHPLPIIEIYHSGHVEPFAVAALVAGALMLARGRRLAASCLLALSILGKLFPVCLIPAAARKLRLRGLSLLLLLLVFSYVPFLGAGVNLVRSFSEYGTRWRFNDSGFALIHGAVQAAGGGVLLKRGVMRLDHATFGTRLRPAVRSLYPYAVDGTISRFLVMLLFASVLLVCLLRRLSFEKSALLATAAFAFLAPTLHPWYLLWLLPFVALYPIRGLLLLTLAVPFSYAVFLGGEGNFGEPSWLKVLIFLPPALLLLLSGLRMLGTRSDQDQL